jgi:hypothetical protein
MTTAEERRFNPNRPDLCSCLRWKGMFVPSAEDLSVPSGNGGLFWCLYTQTCIGPDGQLAEPGNCASRERGCWGRGRLGDEDVE